MKKQKKIDSDVKYHMNKKYYLSIQEIKKI
jgi:hypothetical protein